MKFPKSLKIDDCFFAFDGGTISLVAIDATGNKHAVTLVQRMLTESGSSLKSIPGRLYFDGQLIDVRSKAEAALLELLRSAASTMTVPQTIELKPLPSNTLVIGEDIKRFMQRSPEDNLRATLQEVIDFVGSDEYVKLAAKMDAMKTKTR